MLFFTIISLFLIPLISAHSVVVNPSVASKAVRSDASTSTTCNTAKALANPIKANSAGTFTAESISFNGGVDGATALASALIDTSGTGKSFTKAANILVNGNRDPSAATSSTLTLQIPSGTSCKNGTCFVQTKSLGGFVSCIAVTQGTATNGAIASTGSTTTNANANAKHHHHNQSKKDSAVPETDNKVKKMVKVLKSGPVGKK